MIELPFTPDQVYRAKKKAQALGCIYNSITKGKGNFAGYLGEIVVAKYIGARTVSCNQGQDKFHFDIILKDGSKLECKAKQRTVDPQKEYDVSIAETSMNQKCDVYSFVSVTIDPNQNKNCGVKKVWLCGFITKREFFEKATFWEKGQIDKTNGFRCHRNMYNLPISDLYEDLKDL